jgi:hypothetical protein
MTGNQLPDPFGSVLDRISQDLCSDPHVEAVFLGGSLALGQASPRSDLDLVIIKDSTVPVMERYVRYVEGVQVQVISGPPRQFDIWLEKDRPTGTVIRQISDGQLLFDRHGLGADYQTQARDVVKAGLAPMSTPQIRSRRFRLTELLDDIIDCADDPPQARWLMDTGLATVVETAFLWHQHWTPKGKRALAEIETLDPSLAALCHDFLAETRFSAQCAAFQSLVTYVLEPLGGELREPWTRAPEAVPHDNDSPHARDDI